MLWVVSVRHQVIELLGVVLITTSLKLLVLQNVFAIVIILNRVHVRAIVIDDFIQLMLVSLTLFVELVRCAQS